MPRDTRGARARSEVPTQEDDDGRRVTPRPVRSGATDRKNGHAGVYAGEKGYYLFLKMGLPPETHAEVDRVFLRRGPAAIGSSNPRSLLLALVSQADTWWAEPLDAERLAVPRLVAALADRCAELQATVEAQARALARAEVDVRPEPLAKDRP